MEPTVELELPSFNTSAVLANIQASTATMTTVRSSTADIGAVWKSPLFQPSRQLKFAQLGAPALSAIREYQLGTTKSLDRQAPNHAHVIKPKEKCKIL
ncbi:MAG: hypothetical protein ABIK82_04070 [Pseudomonadota bacterium]